ncbi:hypothetical protein [Microtetraspora sp. NBRC 16547]|uniref:hypothetical protein n=1 Tax=Microtetraspora sp. NBRC 16547 TaxID=3030993 RepID=UPI0024A0DA53|nr:hypothetical protein [Microtetraspora sp. NBRC 16547]GLX00844.1 hypothetical protein Misp02_49300 [Microtetraspora sp. NBRC 16547]
MSDTAEHAELLRLREQVAASRRPCRHLASAVAITLIALGCVLAPVAMVAVWTAGEVWSVDEAAAALEQRGLPMDLDVKLAHVRSLVDEKMPRLSHSAVYRGLWTDTARVARKGLRAITSGRFAYSSLGWVVPAASAALLTVGFLLARSRRRAALGAGLGVAVCALGLAAVLSMARSVYMSTVASHGLNLVAAERYFDTMTRFPDVGLRVLMVLGLLTAAAADFRRSRPRTR